MTPGAHCTGGCVDPRAGLDIKATGKLLCLCRGSNSDRPVVQSVARYYTDWATPASRCIVLFLNQAIQVFRYNTKIAYFQISTLLIISTIFRPYLREELVHVNSRYLYQSKVLTSDLTQTIPPPPPPMVAGGKVFTTKHRNVKNLKKKSPKDCRIMHASYTHISQYGASRPVVHWHWRGSYLFNTVSDGTQFHME
jgi:hypothetical protein